MFIEINVDAYIMNCYLIQILPIMIVFAFFFCWFADKAIDTDFFIA